jgi:hypothetical protein
MQPNSLVAEQQRGAAAARRGRVLVLPAGPHPGPHDRVRVGRSTNASSAVCSSSSESLELWWSVVDQLLLEGTPGRGRRCRAPPGGGARQGSLRVTSRFGLRRDHFLTLGPRTVATFSSALLTRRSASALAFELAHRKHSGSRARASVRISASSFAALRRPCSSLASSTCRDASSIRVACACQSRSRARCARLCRAAALRGSPLCGAPRERHSTSAQ